MIIWKEMNNKEKHSEAKAKRDKEKELLEKIIPHAILILMLSSPKYIFFLITDLKSFIVQNVTL